MSAIVNYMLIEESGSFPELLVQQVQEAIKEGWEPIGGVAVVMDTYTTKLYQAMVKRQPA